MEFGKEKCAMLKMKRGKRQMTEVTEQPNQEKSERSEKKKITNTWECWKRILSNMWRWKKKLEKNTPGEQENYSKPNYIAEISSKEKNTCAIYQVKYTGPFLKRNREELQQMDQRTRKLMMIH